MTDLLFQGALGPQPGGDVQLIFGLTGVPPPEPLPDPRPGLLRASTAVPWRAAAAVPARALAGPWGRSSALAGAAALPWTTTASLGASLDVGWAATGSAGAAVRLPWASTLAVGDWVVAPWRAGLPRREAWALPWRQGQFTEAALDARWRGGLPTASRTLASWRAGQLAVARVRGSADRGLGVSGRTLAPWRAGQLVESIGGPWTPPLLEPEAPIPCYQPDPGNDVLLLFREARTGLAALLFACRVAAVAVIPIRRVYMVTNVTSLTRVSDGANIPCLGFSLSLDVDSWAWGFSASIKADAMALVEPDVDGTPVELAAEVNGTSFRVFVESMGRERTFGQASVRLQGRGKTAVLDSPISPITVFSEVDALTSQQLLDQALPFGWTADFGLDPWLVPGGVWSHQGTPITAAVTIAQAGGGYVQPHPTDDVIRVLPLYPVAPWDWGGVSPDIEIPAAFATREGLELVELPRYNRVYVSGTTAGVLGRVTRLGSAGDALAPMVTDALITTAGAARQRGLPILAKTGRLAYVTLRMPVAEGSGVITPGMFVRYVDGATTRLGLARSVSVEVAGHQVWQTVRLETFA